LPRNIRKNIWLTTLHNMHTELCITKLGGHDDLDVRSLPGQSVIKLPLAIAEKVRSIPD
jgi:hypothetical protein